MEDKSDKMEAVNVTPLIFRGRRTRLKGQRTKQDYNPKIMLPTVNWTKENLRKCQLEDKSAAPIIKYLEEGILPTEKRREKEIIYTSDQYFIEDQVLYHLLDAKIDSPHRQIDEIRACLVVPEVLKFDVLTSVHGDLNDGHHGTQKTYSTLRLKYYWKGMYAD